jgi:hypothetical protein
VLSFALLSLLYAYWEWDYWSELTYDQGHKLKEIRLDRPKIIQQILLTVGGIAAFILAAWRTWTAHKQAQAALNQVQVALRQADLAERVHNVDRYTRAASMLDSDKTAVRQAGVFALLELGRADTLNFYSLVIRFLAGFVRMRSVEAEKRQQRPTHIDSEPEADETAEFADLHDAFRSIGWLRDQRPDDVEGERTAKFTLNLSGTKAVTIDLHEVDFSLVNLRGTDFTGSDFRLAKFWRTDLRYAKLHGVNAQWSNFNQTLFQNTDLEFAQFDSCNFEGVSFADAVFDSTSFDQCNISGARLESSNGLTSEMIDQAWAWKDDPPTLPKGVTFTNFFDPGTKGESRNEYWEMQAHRLGFGPPD